MSWCIFFNKTFPCNDSLLVSHIMISGERFSLDSFRSYAIAQLQVSPTASKKALGKSRRVEGGRLPLTCRCRASFTTTADCPGKVPQRVAHRKWSSSSKTQGMNELHERGNEPRGVSLLLWYDRLRVYMDRGSSCLQVCTTRRPCEEGIPRLLPILFCIRT